MGLWDTDWVSIIRSGERQYFIPGGGRGSITPCATVSVALPRTCTSVSHTLYSSAPCVTRPVACLLSLGVMLRFPFNGKGSMGACKVNLTHVHTLWCTLVY